MICFTRECSGSDMFLSHQGPPHRRRGGSPITMFLKLGLAQDQIRLSRSGVTTSQRTTNCRRPSKWNWHSHLRLFRTRLNPLYHHRSTHVITVACKKLVNFTRVVQLDLTQIVRYLTAWFTLFVSRLPPITESKANENRRRVDLSSQWVNTLRSFRSFIQRTELICEKSPLHWRASSSPQSGYSDFIATSFSLIRWSTRVRCLSQRGINLFYFCTNFPYYAISQY